MILKLAIRLIESYENTIFAGQKWLNINILDLFMYK